MAIKDKWIEFNLDGTNGYVDAKSRGNKAYYVDSTITLEAWIFVDPSAGTSKMGIVSNYDAGGGYGLMLENGQLTFYVNGTSVPSGAGAVATGSWQHVAATYDGTTLCIYVNGTLKNSKTAANLTLTYPNNPSLYIGRGLAQTESYYFKGKICEVRLWDVARTATQLKDNQSAALDSSVDNLRARWPLDDGLTKYANDVRNGANAELQASTKPGPLTVQSTITQPDVVKPSGHIDTSGVLTAALDKLNRNSVKGLLKQLSTQLKSQADAIKTHTTDIATNKTDIATNKTDIKTVSDKLDAHLLNHDQKISTTIDNKIQDLLNKDTFNAAAENLDKLQKELEIVRTAALSLDQNELAAVTNAIADALQSPDLGKLILSSVIRVNNSDISFGTLLNKLARRIEVKETDFSYSDTDITGATFTMTDGTELIFTASRSTENTNVIVYTFNTSANAMYGLTGQFIVKLKKSTTTEVIDLVTTGTTNLDLDEYQPIFHSNVYYDLKLT